MFIFSDAGSPDRRMVKLTSRERHVLWLISCGLSNKDIAFELSISAYTVKGYVQSFILGAGVTNRVQLTRWAHFHPEVFEGHAVDLALHPPSCSCEHPLCVAMRVCLSKVA